VGRLPGPAESRLTLAEGIPVEAWGPIFAGAAGAGKGAEKPLLGALEDGEPERRRAAVALLSRLGLPGTLKAIAALVQDEDAGVAAEAALALAAARKSPVFGPTIAEVRRALASGRPVKATRAARALARIGDADSVPVLIQLLDAGGDLASAASEALTAITMQRLGGDSMRWIAWWREWRAAPRASWLFQALASDDPDLRRRAAAELRKAGEPPEPYDPGGPEAERQRAAKVWAAWWREEGLAL
jgi:HEAT repeat protein